MYRLLPHGVRKGGSCGILSMYVQGYRELTFIPAVGQVP